MIFSVSLISHFHIQPLWRQGPLQDPCVCVSEGVWDHESEASDFTSHLPPDCPAFCVARQEEMARHGEPNLL